MKRIDTDRQRQREKVSGREGSLMCKQSEKWEI